jgi:ABC-type cobalamin/Fe3+-siderophores transport system ATPase subunit
MKYLSKSELQHIQDSTVLITTAITRGTAFAISPNMLLTCAHVIKGCALEEIGLEQQSGRLNASRILANDLNVDLAVIEIKETLSHILPLKPSTSPFGDVFSFGYQYLDRNYFGYPVWGRRAGNAFEKMAGHTRSLILLMDMNIQPGLSGSPLFSFEDRTVVGVVKRDNPDGGGYAIPIDDLQSVLPGAFEANQTLNGFAANYAESLGKYFKEITEEHRYITLMDSGKELLLEDLYTSLTLAPESITGRKLGLGVTGRLQGPDLNEMTKVFVRRDRGSPERYTALPQVAIEELLTQQKTIILGDPGAGKTTLLRHLLARTCKGEILSSRVPIFVKLADLKADAGALKSYLEHSYPYCATDLNQTVTDGEAVIFFDGLDELQKSDQDILQREIGRIAARKNIVFVSCRIAAFPRGLFPGDFKVYECVGFNRSQQRRFISAWFDKEPSKGQAIDQSLMLNHQLAPFAQNPLLLTLICMVVSTDVRGSDLPKRRFILYELAINMLLTRARLSRDLPITEHDLLIIFRELAFTLFARGRESAEKTEIITLIEHYQSRSEKLFLKQLSTERIFEIMLEDVGLLSVHAGMTYRFLHLTFQEYLTAEAIASLPDWLAYVKEKIGDPRWEEVIRLLAAILKKNDASLLLAEIWSGQKDDYERLFLAGRAASDATAVSDGYLLPLVTNLSEIVLSGDVPAYVASSIGSLASLCSTSEIAITNLIGYIHTRFTAGMNFVILSRYLQVLQLAGSRRARTEIARLGAQIINQLSIHDESSLQLHGAVVTAMSRVEVEGAWQLVMSLIVSGATYLEGVGAQCIAFSLPSHVKPQLQQLLTHASSRVRTIAAYCLLQYEDVTLTSTMFSRAFGSGADVSIQDALRQATGFDIHEIKGELILKVMAECTQTQSRAHLIGVSGLFLKLHDRGFLDRYLFDDSVPIVIRCAALETLFTLAPFRTAEIIVRLLDRQAPKHLLLFAIAILRQAKLAVAHEILCRHVDNDDERVLSAVLRLFITVPFADGESWISGILEKWPAGSEVHLLAITAISLLESQDTLNYVSEYLSSGNIRDKIVIYKAIARVGNGAAFKYLLSELYRQSDIMITTQILECLGYFRFTQPEELLIRMLDSHNWPAEWPPPQGPRKRGEQKPTDRRRLTAIVSLNKMRSRRSVGSLQAIVDDPHESGEVKDAAYTAIRNISWDAAIPSEAL